MIPGKHLWLKVNDQTDTQMRIKLMQSGCQTAHRLIILRHTYTPAVLF